MVTGEYDAGQSLAILRVLPHSLVILRDTLEADLEGATDALKVSMEELTEVRTKREELAGATANSLAAWKTFQWLAWEKRRLVESAGYRAGAIQGLLISLEEAIESYEKHMEVGENDHGG